jgi:hypothetical protein
MIAVSGRKAALSAANRARTAIMVGAAGRLTAGPSGSGHDRQKWNIDPAGEGRCSSFGDHERIRVEILLIQCGCGLLDHGCGWLALVGGLVGSPALVGSPVWWITGPVGRRPPR